LSLPLTKAVLEQLARTRVAEAEQLMNAGLWSGAYYLGGYAVELALKACIARIFQPSTIPDKRFIERIFTHNLIALVDLAGLKGHHSAKSKVDPVFAQHWEALQDWSEEARYIIIDRESARALVDALIDDEHGVFEWIRSHW
jgi:HEPN domain-containing protein